MNSTFSLNLKKTIALAIHNDSAFFVVDGVAYEGDEASEREAFRQWCEAKGEGTTADNWRGWLETEGCLLPEYEEDDCHLVLTDEEADEKASEYIKESLWAFNPSFLADVTGIDAEVFEAIQANNRCESNNDAIARLVGDDLESLISDAISSDGAAHFLNTYDGEENEINLKDITGQNEYLFVYRIN